MVEGASDRDRGPSVSVPSVRGGGVRDRVRVPMGFHSSNNRSPMVRDGDRVRARVREPCSTKMEPRCRSKSFH